MPIVTNSAPCWIIRMADGEPHRDVTGGVIHYPNQAEADAVARMVAQMLAPYGTGLKAHPRSSPCSMLACDCCGAGYETPDGAEKNLHFATPEAARAAGVAAGWHFSPDPEGEASCWGCPVPGDEPVQPQDDAGSSHAEEGVPPCSVPTPT